MSALFRKYIGCPTNSTKNKCLFSNVYLYPFLQLISPPPSSVNYDLGVSPGDFFFDAHVVTPLFLLRLHSHRKSQKGINLDLPLYIGSLCVLTVKAPQIWFF